MPQRKFMRKRYPKKKKGVYSGKKLSSLTRLTTTEVTVLRRTLALSSAVTGVIDANFIDDPSLQLDWSSYSALYDRYRVMSVTIKYIPQLPNDTSTVTGFFPLYVVNDTDTTAVAGAVNTVLQYPGVRVYNMYRPWKHTWYCPKYTASGNTVDGFQDIAAVAAHGSIQTYGSGFDVSTTYGNIIVTMKVAFRERR